LSNVIPLRPALVLKPLPVLFRMHSGRPRQLVAFFPTQPTNKNGQYFYTLLHSDWGWQKHSFEREWLRSNRPAKPEEYAAALEELAAQFARPVWQKVGGPGPFRMVPFQHITKEHERQAAERQQELARLYAPQRPGSHAASILPFPASRH
jgi:hypothetical protein